MVKGTKIGLMDRRVTIVEFTTVKGTINENTRTQQTVKDVWAQLKFKASNEAIDEKVYSINERDYIVHYDPVITAKLMQDLAVMDDGKLYYVTGANPDYGGRQKYILFNCLYRG